MPDTSKAPSIFINYRQGKSRDKALILRTILEAYFGEGSVFLGETSVPYGSKWQASLRQGLEQAEVLIALIHEGWHRETNEAGDNRLKTDPDDWVRREIASAKDRIPIIPILIDDAEMPKDEWLPHEIQGLFLDQGPRINFQNLSQEALKKLIRDLSAQLTRWTLREIGNQASIDPAGFYLQTLNRSFPLTPAVADHLPEAASPYVGLKPFSKAEARLFFGRSREVYSLCDKIVHGETRVLLLDGYSGTGKSSLFQAGIIPRIEGQGWAVAYGRREEDKIQGLSGIFARLISTLDRQEGIHKLLILDQLEEAISNPIDILPKELEEVFGALAKALQQYPNYTFLLGFRSEYTAQVRQKLQILVKGFDEENTLYPLDRSGIIEAIGGATQLRQKYPLYFVPETLPRTIADQGKRIRVN